MSEPIGGLIRQYETEIDLLRRIADAVIVAGSLLLAAVIYGVPFDQRYGIVAALAPLFFYLFGKFNNLYMASRYRRLTEEITPVVTAWFWTAAVLLGVAYVFKATGSYSRVALGLWFVMAPTLLIGWRWGVRHWLQALRSRGYNTRNVVIVGTGKSARHLAETIRNMPWTGLVLKGFVTTRANPTDADADTIGGLEDLYRMARSGEVEVVYIAVSMSRHERIAEILERLSDTTVSTFLVPDFDLYGIMQGRWVTVGDVPTVSVVDTPMVGINTAVKRLEDLVVAGFVLVLAAPLMLLVALAIKLDSRGPVFYIQNRYGLNGTVIPVMKFRTMRVVEGDEAFTQATRNDDRVTRVGRILRKTSLDELPQLFNVLAGQMSMVGPRPHAVAHNEEFRGTILGYMLRHKVKPGLTGLAQINGFRGETDTVEKMEQRCHYDLEYLSNWSVWLDLKIILMTPWALLRAHNAY